jgi:hypothetical protein
MNKPVPVNATVTIPVRTISSAGSEPNTSCKMAQNKDNPTIRTRERKPAASIIGNRYRRPSSRYGSVFQSMMAIETIRTAAIESVFARFFGACMNERSTRAEYIPSLQHRKQVWPKDTLT